MELRTREGVEGRRSRCRTSCPGGKNISRGFICLKISVRGDFARNLCAAMKPKGGTLKHPAAQNRLASCFFFRFCADTPKEVSARPEFLPAQVSARPKKCRHTLNLLDFYSKEFVCVKIFFASKKLPHIRAFKNPKITAFQRRFFQIRRLRGVRSGNLLRRDNLKDSRGRPAAEFLFLFRGLC